MRATERVSFESDASKRIYEYVERHGTAKRNILLDVAAIPSHEFCEDLERLKTNGYLEEDSGTLRLAMEVGAADEYETEGGTATIRPARQSDFEGLIDTIRDATAEHHQDIRSASGNHSAIRYFSILASGFFTEKYSV